MPWSWIGIGETNLALFHNLFTSRPSGGKNTPAHEKSNTSAGYKSRPSKEASKPQSNPSSCKPTQTLQPLKWCSVVVARAAARPPAAGPPAAAAAAANPAVVGLTTARPPDGGTATLGPPDPGKNDLVLHALGHHALFFSLKPQMLFMKRLSPYPDMPFEKPVHLFKVKLLLINNYAFPHPASTFWMEHIPDCFSPLKKCLS